MRAGSEHRGKRGPGPKRGGLIYSRTCQDAIRFMVRIAEKERASGEWVPLALLTRELGLPKPSAAITLQRLRRRGLLSGRRGPFGGFRLARPADRIKVLQIIEAMGDLGLSGRCVQGLASCSDETACSAHEAWSKARARLEGGFEKRSLQELVDGARAQPRKESSMATNVFMILDELQQNIEELRAALAPLAALSGAAAHREAPKKPGRPARAPKPAPVATKAAAPAAKRKMSPKLKAFRQLQGKYLGVLRGLNGAKREEIKKIQAEKGYEAAMKAAAVA